jgi:hypothetical protein
MTIKSNFPSIRPSLNLDFANTRALDPRITFTRTTTATYYDGKTTAKAEENLFLRSQEFNETIWTKTSLVATANTEVAPDGTTTAETLTAVAAASVHAIVQSVPTNSLIRTVSVFAKEGTHSYIQFCTQGDVTPFANFDLDLGVVGTKAASVTSSITSVGNGWYRCTMEYTSATATTIDICLVSSDSATRRESWTALGTETVYLWGAQLEQRSAVTAYTPTTTAPITNYIPVLQTAASGVARFDHGPLTGESLGLLVEEQRTNLFLYSDELNTWGSTTRSSVVTNQTIAPNGTLTADVLVDTTDNNTHELLNAAGVSFTSGTSYTYSLFVKAKELNQVALFLPGAAFGSGTFQEVIFNLSNQTTSTSSGTPVVSSFVSVGNGWYRIGITASATTTITGFPRIRLASNGATSYAGNGYNGIYIWGAQLEAGAFPTSYIATVAATVTRNADAASMTGTNFSSWYRADEGTVYAEATIQNTAAGRFVAAIQDGSNNNTINIATDSSTGGIRGGVTTGGVLQTAGMTASTATVNTPFKAAFGYKTNDTIISSVGLISSADTSVILPVVSEFTIGTRVSGQLPLNGHIRKIAFYPSRLSNAQLQALTTV